MATPTAAPVHEEEPASVVFVVVHALGFALVDCPLGFQGFARLLLVENFLAIATFLGTLPAVLTAQWYETQWRQETQEATAA